MTQTTSPTRRTRVSDTALASYANVLTVSDDEDDGYGDEDDYGDEMDYDDEGMSGHDDDDVSDDDEEELGEMGPIEGLHGDPVLEVIVDEDDDMDEDDEDEDTSEESDEDMDSDEFEDQEDRVEIAVEEDDLMEDDGNPDWESATDSDEEDGEALGFDAEDPHLDDDHHHHHHHHLTDGDILGNITRAVIGAGADFDPDDVDDLGDGYMDDGRDDDGSYTKQPPWA